MWARKYKDYPPDTDLKKEQVESNSGIVGCEMHELFGWGSAYDEPHSTGKKGFFRTLLIPTEQDEH